MNTGLIIVSYGKLYERVGSVVGWDFSQIEKRTKTIGEKWDFLGIVRNYVTRETVLLDVGTGGGKKLLYVAKFVTRAYGIDNSKGMIATASRNLRESKMSNVEFILADAKNLPFPKESLDVAMCRQAPFCCEEVFYVLKSHGVFLTQQVGEEDKHNIKDVFRRGQSFGEKPGRFMRESVQELKRAGFEISRKDAYNATEYYADMADLIFLLRNTPLIPDFDIEKDERYLEEIEKRYKTSDGIETNSSRFLMICRKP